MIRYERSRCELALVIVLRTLENIATFISCGIFGFNRKEAIRNVCDMADLVYHLPARLRLHHNRRYHCRRPPSPAIAILPVPREIKDDRETKNYLVLLMALHMP